MTNFKKLINSFPQVTHRDVSKAIKKAATLESVTTDFKGTKEEREEKLFEEAKNILNKATI